MKFPYPESHEDWQTPYTRDHAHGASGSHASRSNLAFFVGVIVVSTYLSVVVSRYIKFSSMDSRLVVALAMGLMGIVAVLFAVIYSRALKFASMFLAEFYNAPEGMELDKLIQYRLNGVPKLPPPLNIFVQFQYILANNGEIIKSDKWPAWMSRFLGGPLLLIVFDGCALYLERGNRFSRVVGPGDKIPFLEWYETIKYIVDFRPKTHTDKFDVWTKDGIKLNLTVQIECRIGDPKKHAPTSKLVYPYDPVAIKQAIERYSVRWPERLTGEPSEFNWLHAAWGQVTGVVPNYIGSRVLDDLFVASRNNGQILSPDSMRDIFEKINEATHPFGVFVTDFQVLEVKLPKVVEKAQKDLWLAEKQGLSALIDGEAKAFSIRTREKARAEAQRDIIIAIADGLRKNEEGRFEEPLLLSLSGILDESLNEPLTRAYLAKETLDALEQLQNNLNQNESSDFDSLFNTPS